MDRQRVLEVAVGVFFGNVAFLMFVHYVCLLAISQN